MIVCREHLGSLSNELILLATIHDMYRILAHCKHKPDNIFFAQDC